MYNGAWYDLHDGFSQLLAEFFVENKALFNSQHTIHIILIVVMVSVAECAVRLLVAGVSLPPPKAAPVCQAACSIVAHPFPCRLDKLSSWLCLPCCAQVLGGAAFLLLMLRPFLRHISKESRRCAELLVQLPLDFDVEGMVAATWGVVKNVSGAGLVPTLLSCPRHQRVGNSRSRCMGMCVRHRYCACCNPELTLTWIATAAVACLQERLLVERSGRTFFETGDVMGTLRELSKSFLGPRPPLQSSRCVSCPVVFHAWVLYIGSHPAEQSPFLVFATGASTSLPGLPQGWMCDPRIAHADMACFVAAG